MQNGQWILRRMQNGHSALRNSALEVACGSAAVLAGQCLGGAHCTHESLDTRACLRVPRGLHVTRFWDMSSPPDDRGRHLRIQNVLTIPSADSRDAYVARSSLTLPKSTLAVGDCLRATVRSAKTFDCLPSSLLTGRHLLANNA
jgi:hypothetical protein